MPAHACDVCGAPLDTASACPHCTAALGLPATVTETTAAPAAVPASLPPGFELVRELGRGGMGVVYLARHQRLGRLCALKMIRSGEQASAAERDRFEAEARAAATLAHPHVVQVYEIGEHHGQLYLALEYCPGGALDQRLRENVLPARAAARLVRALAEALEAAHAVRLIHRDLKPANVLLDAAGTPRVADFGLAKRLDEDGQTRPGVVVGTPSYMPPEQARGAPDIGPAVDIYALGAILYATLTGRAPFKGATVPETLRLVVEAEPVAVRDLAPGTPRDLETICFKCLRKEPRQRYRSAQALADDLGRFLAGEPIHARPVGLLERAVKWVRRNAVVSALTSAVVLVLLVGLAVSLWLWRLADDRATKEGIARGVANEKSAEAQRQTGIARQETARANDQLLRRELRDYAIELAQAQREREQGQEDACRAILDAAQWDLRGWEHDFLAGGGKERLTLRGHTDMVFSATWSPDDRRILTGSRDGTARVWDATSGDELFPLKGHTDGVYCVAWSPDGTEVATASYDGTAKVWDAKTGKVRLTLKGHEGRVLSVAWRRDGKQVLTASWDQTARTWDATTGTPVHTLTGHTAPLFRAIYGPDGQTVFSGSVDHSVRRWDAATGKEQAAWRDAAGFVSSLAFHPDGKHFVSGNSDGTIRVRAADSGRVGLLLHQAENVLGVAFSPDGWRLATTSGKGVLRVWEPDKGIELLAFQADPKDVTSVAWSADGTRLLTAGVDGTARVWEAGPRQATYPLKGHRGLVTTLALSPEGRHLLSGGTDPIARLWDLQKGRSVLTLTGHTSRVTAVDYHPGGERLLTSSYDKTARVWDAVTGRELLTLTGHEGFVSRACYSPDGTRILTASYDATARVWDAASGAELLKVGPASRPLLSAAWSHDGTTLHAWDGVGQFLAWDAATGAPVLTAEVARPVLDAVASPDGRLRAKTERAQIDVTFTRP